MDNPALEHDFIVVGSGPGGGPLAANLALHGFNVLLIEAGENSINDNYSVPAFHARASEDPNTSWEFFVNHYNINLDENANIENRSHGDRKFSPRNPIYPQSPGIFYPRASALGGCTAHHALITVYPSDRDWDTIAQQIGDNSWSASEMRKYFDRIQNAQYRDGSVFLNLLQPPTVSPHLDLQHLTAQVSEHGVSGPSGAGWLDITQADPLLLLNDINGVLKIVTVAFETAMEHGLRPMPGFNPNDPRVSRENLVGVNVIPISIRNGRRVGARERVLDAQRMLRYQKEQGRAVGQLDLVTNTFATEIVFADDDPTRAVGVRCSPGVALYNARHHARQPGQKGADVVYHASKEVIVCGGAFNTPQLLMLSGIGPRAELEKFGITCRVDSPGVGKNLQDRYEVGVVARATAPFRYYGDATFKAPEDDTATPEAMFTHWTEAGEGVYGTNGTVLGIVNRSTSCKDTDPPDLFIFGFPLDFRGYEIGYSEKAGKFNDHFTWCVLKGHTDNTSGTIELRSTNPFDTPIINFRYFEDSNESHEKDLQSVVDGIKFVQEINRRLEEKGVIAEELSPRAEENLFEFVKNNAWGHHASCSCKIGSDEDGMAVLDNNFQVRGAKGLRVVDASVFPRIPGLFIVSAVYMVAEKASDILINKYRDG